MGLSNYDPGQELSSINFAGMIGGPLSAVVNAQSQAALASVSFIKSVGFSPDTEDVTTGTVTPGTPVYVTFKYPKMVAPYVPAVIGGEISTATVVSGHGGSGYAVGDVLTLGSGGATVRVDAETSGGATAVSVVSGGSGYTNGAKLNPTGGAVGATGLELEITTKDRDASPAIFEQMMLEVPILTMLPIPFIRIDFAEIDFHAKITSMEYQNSASELKTSQGTSIKSDNTSTFGLNLGKFLTIENKNTTSVQLNVNISSQKSVKEGFKIDKTFQLGVKVRASQDEMPAGMEKILGILEDAIVAQPLSALDQPTPLNP